MRYNNNHRATCTHLYLLKTHQRNLYSQKTQNRNYLGVKRYHNTCKVT